MALHFGKRELDQPKTLSTGMAGPRYGQPATGTGTPAQAQQQAPQYPGSEPEVKAPVVSAGATPEGGSKLTVGPNIKLKGVEITDCDTLVVEGMVEATMDSRVIRIAEQGAFKGSAEVDVAEVHGTIDGNLTVRQRLVIHATGRVTGRIRYGKVVIEEGGQLSGDIECSASVSTAKAGGSKPSMALAA